MDNPVIRLHDIRSCHRKYLKRIRAMFHKNYAYQAMIVLKLSKLSCLMENDVVMGSIAYRRVNNVIHVTSVMIHEEHRSRGLGTVMMGLFIDKIIKLRGIETISLFVEVDNTIALTLYKRSGFTVVGNETDPSGLIHYHLMARTI